MHGVAAVQLERKAAPSPPMRTAISRRSTLGTVRKAGGRVDTGPMEVEESEDCREADELLLKYRSAVGRGSESAREREPNSTGLALSALRDGEGRGDEVGVSCKKVALVRGDAMSQVPGMALSMRSIVFC